MKTAVCSFLSVFLLILMSVPLSYAQSIDSLRSYLKGHAINFTGANGEAFDRILHGKSILVFGECHHELKYNDTVRGILIRDLGKNPDRPLNRFYLEYGRSTAFLYNCYLVEEHLPIYGTDSNMNALIASNYNYIASGTIANLSPINNNLKFEGIDFERPYSFFIALQTILKNKSYTSTSFTKKLIPDFNTVEAFMSEKGYKGFITQYYPQLATEYQAQKALLTKELDDTTFNRLTSLLTNKQNTPDKRDRNPGMAANLLLSYKAMIAENPNGLAILDMGMAHTNPNRNFSTVSIAAKSSELRNKITVMNTYCRNCTVRGEVVENNAYKTLNRAIYLSSFEEIADSIGDAVLFDLSDLPEAFTDLRENGDLLLFLSNKN